MNACGVCGDPYAPGRCQPDPKHPGYSYCVRGPQPEPAGLRAVPDVLAPPETGPTCHACRHVTYPYGETHCLLYNEPILSERLAASDCPEYSPEEIDPCSLPS